MTLCYCRAALRRTRYQHFAMSCLEAADGLWDSFGGVTVYVGESKRAFCWEVAGFEIPFVSPNKEQWSWVSSKGNGSGGDESSYRKNPFYQVAASQLLFHRCLVVFSLPCVCVLTICTLCRFPPPGADNREPNAVRVYRYWQNQLQRSFQLLRDSQHARPGI